MRHCINSVNIGNVVGHTSRDITIDQCNGEMSVWANSLEHQCLFLCYICRVSVKSPILGAHARQPNSAVLLRKS